MAPQARVPAARGELRERDLHNEQLIEIQRSRLIAGAVRAVDELGYAKSTVGQITRRASVSRRTFYELFANHEECLAAVLDEAIAAVAQELVAADLDGLAWRERIRRGLTAILGFFDRDPALARVCVVQALRGGPRVLERREQALAALTATVNEGRREAARGAGCTPLTAEGLVGAAFGIVHARLLREEREPLLNLLPELMGMVVLPYLGLAAARREQAREAPPVTQAEGAEGAPHAPAGREPLWGVPLRLTYRTTRVLEGVAARPGASNRVIGEYAGVNDPGQISKLLARLERVGLLVNAGERHAGEPNAWSLTAKGEQVARSIRVRAPRERRAA